MSDAVRGMFATIANRYDLANRLLSAGRDVAWRRKALAMLDPPPQLVLDLACGTYDLGLDALAQGRASKVIGTDFCLPMLQAGTDKRTGKAIVGAAGDALRLPYADGTFDAAVMAYGWRNLDDPGAGVDELFRVLRPGGQLMLLEFFKPTSWWPRFFYGSFGRFVFPVIGGLVTGDASAYRYLYDSIQGFVTVPEAQDLLVDRGFTEVQWQSFFGGISHAVCVRRPEDDAC